MKIIFFGSGEFAVLPLQALASLKHNLVCVVTQPDREQGRGLSILPTSVKKAALLSNLPVFHPKDVNSQESVDFLKKFNADLFIVIAYGQILSSEVLSIPQALSLNIHASLLPKYRGAAPINWALINGENETGVTFMKMARAVDSGEIIAQNKVNISSDDNALTLGDKLSKLAAESLPLILRDIKGRAYKLIPQDATNVSLAPKLSKENGLINWNVEAKSIFNLVRGCLPWPGAFTYYRGKLLKIFVLTSVKVSECQDISVSGKDDWVSGEIIKVSQDGLMVAVKDGALLIKELQLEGKKRMTVEEFICGHKVLVGEILKSKTTNLRSKTEGKKYCIE